MRKLFEYLPLQFRVVYRQFLLRVIDLEALSIQADVTRFLGQFAGVLLMISLIYSLGPLFHVVTFSQALQMEQSLISMTMLVIGLITVVSWDAAFPDRRDVLVLAPLPIAPRTILCAKVAASVAILGIAVLTLNTLPSIECAVVLGTHHGSYGGVLRSFAAYWFTLAAASAFLYCSVLTVQGFSALLLPRRVFLRLSAILQLVAFGLFLAAYFLQPDLPTYALMAAPENHQALMRFPCFWFFALGDELNGTLPPALMWLAWRAWIGLGFAVSGAAASLLLCYVRTLRKTVEEPDLVPAAGGLHWAPHFGSSLQTAIALFCIRSLTRSRQHRVAFAFYLAIVFAIALSLVRTALAASVHGPPTMDFMLCTFLMMSFAVVGLRNVFSLPISLTANWVLRITQLHPTQKYLAATRWSLILFAALPVWIGSALLSFSFRPLHEIAAHLAVLALLGFIFADLSLIGFYKVPFTCSYLPGKSNIQFVFWGFLALFLPLAMLGAEYERRVLNDPVRFSCVIGALVAVALGLWAFNRYRAKSAVLYFEELPEEVITTLGLTKHILITEATGS
ncbi:hypothetical protein [Granulicella sp. S156]|uniref:hypothetical protein n=1 Tax=Granulicella sp. S156 TaxID=1747224 RepID=UPI00131DFF73|nr:hypothetical protein [Granulicella sp. S156]